MSNNSASTNEFHRRICWAIDFVNAHLAENLVAEVAAAAPFSPFHFQCLFRAIVGETVTQFTRRLRLETAARRLKFADVTDMTGLSIDPSFSSSRNFAKAFKNHFGVSPNEFRDQDISLLEHSDQQRLSRTTHLKISVRNVASMRVAYLRHLGSYDSPEVHTAFENLQRWAKARELQTDDQYLGIPWDEATITPNDKCRFDAGLIVKDDAWFGSGVNRC